MSVRRPTDPRIRVGPQALDDLAAGFDHMAALMAVTLGPTQGPILNALSGGSVERISDAGTIARRVVAVPNRGRNTGSMILRHLAWQMHERFGNGAATAAVLARAMVRAGRARIAADVDPVSIRRGLEQALTAALAALPAQVKPVAGPEMLAGVATGITGDSELGAVLAEIVDVLGADAAMTIEEFPVAFLDREYVAGSAWRARPASRAMIPEGRPEIVLENPLILLADQHLSAVDDVLPALEIAAQATCRRPLLIVPAKIGDHALATIAANHAQGRVTAIASLLSETGPALSDALCDLAVLTNATVLADVSGRPPRRVRPEDLGSARKSILSRDTLTIVSGAGDSLAAGERAALLRRRMVHPASGSEEWRRLQTRVARLSGGSAVLKIGAHNKPELAHRRAQAEKAFQALCGILAAGVVPGGGVAYLECGQAVRSVRGNCAMVDDEHGVDVFLGGLEAPFQQIVHNHGLVHPPVALQTVRRLGCGYGFDVLNRTCVNMRQQGVLDSLQVTQGALQLATSAAIAVLTTGALVLPASDRQPQRVRP